EQTRTLLTITWGSLMKRTCRIVSRQLLLSVLFITVAVAPLYGQQPGSQSTSQTSEERRGDVVVTGTPPSATAVDQDSTQTKRTGTQPYVFPTHHERFKRFVKSTVGPVILGRTAISAGIDQW